MRNFELGEINLKVIAIRVKNRDLLIHFYRDIIGFQLLREENELAILGYKDTAKEVIWLEESPRAADHTGEIKKLRRLTVIVPNEEELANVLYRAHKNEYPVKTVFQLGEKTSVIIEDPEGNEIEVSNAPSQQDGGTSVSTTSLTTLMEKATKKRVIQEAYVDKVHLNVSQVSKQRTFLTTILGFAEVGEDTSFFTWNKGKFNVELTYETGGTIDEETAGVLGLDFIQFKITDEQMAALLEHFSQEQQTFFVNKKKTLATIYDPTGIEWWFMVH